MKLFIKLKNWVYKYGLPLGIVFLLYSVSSTWSFRPANFYPQKSGVLHSIGECRVMPSGWRGYGGFENRRKYNANVDCYYVFNIDNELYSTIKADNENYYDLLGKTVVFRYGGIGISCYYGNRMYPSKAIGLTEITYNENVYFSVNQYYSLFIKWIILFLLSVLWCIWIFTKKYKSTKINLNEEEYFFDNWGVFKKADKYTLSYISKLGGNVNHRKITEEEFMLVKDGKMFFEDFSSKYNLW